MRLNFCAYVSSYTCLYVDTHVYTHVYTRDLCVYPHTTKPILSSQIDLRGAFFFFFSFFVAFLGLFFEGACLIESSPTFQSSNMAGEATHARLLTCVGFEGACVGFEVGFGQISEMRVRFHCGHTLSSYQRAGGLNKSRQIGQDQEGDESRI